MSGFRLRLIVLLISAAAGGCAKVQARTEPVMPELTPPPPPPRVVETYADDTPAPAETPASESAANTPSARNTGKPPATPSTAKPVEPPKPEPARTELERPASQPPALTLKPAPGSQSTTEASIRTLLANAARDLSRVNYSLLNQDGKAQYDTAKRFMQQAEDALRNGNLVFAGKLADKAATMAGVLVR